MFGFQGSHITAMIPWNSFTLRCGLSASDPSGPPGLFDFCLHGQNQSSSHKKCKRRQQYWKTVKTLETSCQSPKLRKGGENYLKVRMTDSQCRNKTKRGKQNNFNNFFQSNFFHLKVGFEIILCDSHYSQEFKLFL